MVIACSTAVRCASSLETALADIAGAGFDTVDLLAIDGWVHVHTRDLAARFEETAAGLDALLTRHGLRLAAMNTGVGPQLHDRSPEANARRAAETAGLVRLMRRYGVPLAAVQPRDADRSRPWDEVLRDCAATLREQQAAAAAEGVTFALELHVRSPFETLDQARRTLDAVPGLTLVYDPTHFVMQGVALEETFWLLDHARHVHLRDAAPGQMQTPLGAGVVDFDRLLGELRERGYDGGISIEYLETDSFDALDSARRLADLIRAKTI